MCLPPVNTTFPRILKNDPLLFEGNRNHLFEGYGGAGIPIHSTDGTLGVLIVQT
jgi:hypothetical protein